MEYKSMALAYIPYLILLAISPVLGMYMLKFVYPDVKTYLKPKKWALFIAFGLAAYVPAAFLSVFEIVIPVYSPLGKMPLLFESEGNVLFMVAVFLGVLAINSSLVDFTVVRRKKTVIVGVPKQVISYSIRQQIAETKKATRAKEIKKITNDIENIAQGQGEVKLLLDKIRLSVAAEQQKPASDEKAAETEAALKEIFGPLPKQAEIPKGVQLGERARQLGAAEKPEVVVEKRQVVRGRRKQAKEVKEPLEEIISRLDESSRDIKMLAKAEPLPREARPSIIDDKQRQIEETKKMLREALSAGVVPREDEKEALMMELEAKLKSATSPGRDARVQGLLDELKGKVRESYVEAAYPEGDIEEITSALREMKRGEEKEAEERRARHRVEKKPEEEMGESLVSYQKAYGRGEGDVMKAVVGDVRQQLTEGKPSEKEAQAGKRWYEKEGVMPKAESAGAPSDVELFEQDMSFGEGAEGLGELGLEGLGDLGSLEDLGENLDSSSFDGMFVDLGSAKGGCPNYGKKGTAIVYCSSCGKPLCSNCAKSVEGGEEFVKYTCPHCDEDFAMKRRLTA